MAVVRRTPNNAKNAQYLTRKEKGGKKMSLFLAGTSALIQADMGGSQTSSQSGDKGIDQVDAPNGSLAMLKSEARQSAAAERSLKIPLELFQTPRSVHRTMSVRVNPRVLAETAAVHESLRNAKAKKAAES